MVTTIGGARRPHLYIDEWTEELGLSDEKIANRIGVARETVYRWRKEQNRLNPEKIAALADAMGIEPTDLWRRPEEKKKSIDDLVRDVDNDTRETAYDIVSRMVKKAS